jgi:hypothetical protein
MDALLFVILVAIFLALPIYMTVVCVQKGKTGCAVAGWFVGWFHIFGAIRLAKPDSTWAMKNYLEGSDKLHRAEARFGKRSAALAAR